MNAPAKLDAGLAIRCQCKWFEPLLTPPRMVYSVTLERGWLAAHIGTGRTYAEALANAVKNTEHLA